MGSLLDLKKVSSMVRRDPNKTGGRILDGVLNVWKYK